MSDEVVLRRGRPKGSKNVGYYWRSSHKCWVTKIKNKHVPLLDEYGHKIRIRDVDENILVQARDRVRCLYASNVNITLRGLVDASNVNITLQQLVDTYISTHELKWAKSTTECRRPSLNRFTRAHPTVAATCVTPNMVHRYMDKVKMESDHFIRLIKQLYKWAVKARMILVDPLKGLKPLKDRQSKAHICVYFTRDDNHPEVVKIGKSTSPGYTDRFKAFKTGCYHPNGPSYTTLAYLNYDDENRLHKHLRRLNLNNFIQKDRRGNREMFRYESPIPEMVEYLNQCNGQPPNKDWFKKFKVVPLRLAA